MPSKQLIESNLVCALVAAMLGALLSGAGFWMSVGRFAVSRADVSEMIIMQSPYIEDRKLLTEALRDTREQLRAQAEAIQEMKQAIVRMEAKIGR